MTRYYTVVYREHGNADWTTLRVKASSEESAVNRCRRQTKRERVSVGKEKPRYERREPTFSERAAVEIACVIRGKCHAFDLSTIGLYLRPTALV